MQKEKKRNRKLYLLKSETGMTIVELLITLAVGAIIIAVIYSIYISQIQGQATQRAALEMQQGLRAALIIMEREIRTAGADPLGIANTGVEFADFNDFHFTHDIRGAGDMEPDGNHDDPDENIRYCITGNGHLGRATAGSNTFQPILDNVDALNFVYLDRAGNRLNTPIADNNLNRIRQVQVTIVAIAWILLMFFITNISDLEIFFILILIGLLLLKESTDDIIGVHLRKRTNVFNSLLLIGFVVIMGKTIINI